MNMEILCVMHLEQLVFIN